MASGFFAVFDDVIALMDDVASMSKVATKKTAGILGDDLAVNAEKAIGFVSKRELPVIWAITKGSFLNKLIILPLAFLLSYFLPIAVTIALILGGLYLAYEGAEKIYHYFFPKPKKKRKLENSNPTPQEVVNQEKSKIKSAIRTDFILSVEIIIIALGSTAGASILVQIVVVSLIAILATIGVYGIVALLVRMDDVGNLLIVKYQGENDTVVKIGRFLVLALPWIIKALTIVGTIALLLVSGGIFVHNIDFFHHLLHQLPSLLQEFIIGLIVGIAVLLAVNIFSKVFKRAE